jgi:hypothetical protein
LRGFLKELGFEQLEPTIIYVDNIAAKYLAESLDNISNNVGHLVVELNYIKEQVLNGIIEIKYMKTGDQVADILTKPLAYGFILSTCILSTQWIQWSAH